MRHNTRGMLSWTVTALLTVALSTGVVALTTGSTAVSSAATATTQPSTQGQSSTVHYTTTYHGDDNYAVLPAGYTVKSTKGYTDH